MFERYTERARRVIFFARYEASQSGSATIESEHLLLGLIREDKNLTSRFLRSVESIREEIEGRITFRQTISTSRDLPLSNECKRILAYASEEQQALNHRQIGTEHLLLGILREEKCLAAEVLSNRGLRLDAIRDELQHGGVEREAMAPNRPQLSASIAIALETAADEAAKLGDTRVEPSHLLLGLLSDQDSQIAKFLEKHGITRDEVRREMSASRKAAESEAAPMGSEKVRGLRETDG